MGTLLLCITAIAMTALVCECVKECRRIDNDAERTERENRNLWKKLEQMSE